MEYIIYYKEKNSKDKDERHEIISGEDENDAIRRFKQQNPNMKVIDIDEY